MNARIIPILILLGLMWFGIFTKIIDSILIGIAGMCFIIFYSKFNFHKHVFNLSNLQSHDFKFQPLSELQNVFAELIRILEPIRSTSLLKRTESILEQDIHRGIISSGTVGNPRQKSITNVTLMIISLIICVPSSIVLILLINNNWFIGILLIPVVFLLWNKTQLYLKTLERKTLIEYELPFFLTYCAIMEGVGIPLYNAMLNLHSHKSNLFKIINNEVAMIKRYAITWKHSYVETFIHVAQNHPNKVYSNFLFDYVHVVTNGTDTTMFLNGLTDRLYGNLESKMKRYVDVARLYAEVIMIVFLVMPIFIMTFGFIGASHVQNIIIFVILLFPIIAVFFLLLIDGSQQKIDDNVSFSNVSFLLGALLFFVFILLDVSIWFSLGSGILVCSSLNAIVVHRQFRLLRDMDDCIVNMVHLISKNQIVGITISESIRQMNTSNFTNNTAQQLIRLIHSCIMRGKEISEIAQRLQTRPWLSIFLLFILGNIQRYEGGHSGTLRRMELFAERFHQTRKHNESAIRGHLIFIYIGLGMLLFVKLILLEIAKPEIFDPGTFMTFGFNLDLSRITDDLNKLFNLMIILSVTLASISISKICYHTVKHTMNLSFTMIIVLVILSAEPILQDIIGKIF
ncbi:MAG: hypothetical protein R1F52_00095 [Candidatus Nitrosoabyssus spongiisocia]|nr:MAG: hypothetical protein R1F52_00095 [Nitrosopumilaceae archaeon AB1(1)]